MSSRFANLKGDIYGGITAGIVALPLALAFGVASGVGPIAGLYGAIIVGFFAAVFGGTPTQISGPTGPMVVVFAGIYATFADRPELVFTTVVLAGLLMIAFGVLRFGDYIRLVPYPVISGFMSGIGCIIIILQFGRLFGHETPPGPLMALREIPAAVMDAHLPALSIAALTLAIVFFWPARLGRYLPGPLAALLIATPVAMLIGNVPVLGDIPTGLPTFVMPSITADSFLLIFETALILAALGSIDSLLTSLVADNLTRSKHNSNRELIGQGIGNMLAGLFGAVPGAGATMRTVINIRAGGRTRLSGAIHSLLLLAIVLGLGPLAANIPHAALAGILVKVGYDIVDWKYLRRAHKGPRWDLVLMLLVLGLTVFVDLITAVAIGVVLAALAFIRQLARQQMERLSTIPLRELSEEEAALVREARGRLIIFDFGGPLSFGAAADLGHHVRERTKNGASVMLLDFSRVPFLDLSAAYAVETVLKDAAGSRKHVLVSGLNDEVRSVLEGLSILSLIDPANMFESRKQALPRVREMLAAT
ncbi:MAG: SulP family inorganic anion transporter [Rhodothalassiaceae bacterium]